MDFLWISYGFPMVFLWPYQHVTTILLNMSLTFTALASGTGFPDSQAECEFHGQAAAHGETQQYLAEDP